MPTTVASLQAVLGADTTAFVAGLRNVDGRLSSFGQSVGRSMQRTGATLTAAVSLPLIGIGVAATQAAMDWESSFAGVRKTVEGSEDDLLALDNQLREMATSPDSLVSGLEDAHTQLARIAELGGQLGVPLEQIASFTDTIAQLTMSTDLTADSAAMMSAQFAAITGMDYENFDRFGASIVALGNNMATTESTILEFAQRLAGVGKNVGMSEADILALGAAMASVGLNAEAGGTAMTQVMNEITTAVSKGGSNLEAFASTAGMSASEFANAWRSDPMSALTAFIEGLGDLSADEQIQLLEQLGLDGVRTADVLKRLANAEDLLSTSTKISNQAWVENTALVYEAGQRAGTSESNFNRLKNNLTDLGIAVGNEILPVFNDLVTDLTKFVNNLADADPGMLRMAIGLGLLAVAAGPVITGLGSVVRLVGMLGLPGLLAGGALLMLANASGQLGKAAPLAGEGLLSIGDAVMKLAEGDTEGALTGLSNGLGKLAEAGGLITGGIADRVIGAIESLTGEDLPSAADALLVGADLIESAWTVIQFAFENGAWVVKNAIDRANLVILTTLQEVRNQSPLLSGILGVPSNIDARVAAATAESYGPLLGQAIVDQVNSYLAGEAVDFYMPQAVFQVDGVTFTGVPDIMPGSVDLIQQALQTAFSSGDTAALEFLLPLTPVLDTNPTEIMESLLETLAETEGTMAAEEALFNVAVPTLATLDLDPDSLIQQFTQYIREAAANEYSATAWVNVRLQAAGVDASSVNAAVQQTANSVGFGTSMPHFANGGRMMDDGLAWIRRDEVVLSPQDSAAARGGGVVIENLTAYGQSPYEILQMVQRAALRAAPGLG